MDVTEGTDNTKPKHMTYKLLEEITGGFSDDNMLGRGGFGVVYKGVDKDGQKIAVKLLHSIDLDDKEFLKEFNNISTLKHPNIVQLVGLCSEEEEERIKHNGQLVRAARKRRALCFEYMQNGSLEEYISDEHQGLSWQARYRIIKGICEGLKYLHTELESPICHLDLKPANILLDENMLPKIADFGMSRLIGEENTKRTINLIGSKMYMPPEFINYQLTSKEYDIYSLGIIIIMVMVGPQGYSDIADMEPARFFELVLTKWWKRLQKIQGYMSFEADFQQVKKCTEIASKCIEYKKYRRPSIEFIVDLLPLSTNVSTNPSKSEQPFSIHCLNPAGLLEGGDSMGRIGSMDFTKPRHIPYRLLETNTDGFSESHLVGSGGFGKVYKGVKDGQEIAVKLLHSSNDLDDKLFSKELQHIISLKHSNIVQLVGFCNEEEQEYIEYNGKLLAVVRKRRALCFEYMLNGSLEQHIYDEHQGLSWPSRYRIIKGICEGLKYLHTGLGSPIVHSNLKPANILLDTNMVPKISGFGLSRILDGGNTSRTSNLIGTGMYMPPEYKNYGIISKEYDIYSLGVTIINIVAGHKGPSLIDEMGSAEFVKLVHKKRRERLHETPGYKSFEADCEQVKKCIEIASQCIDQKRSRRPSIELIVDLLNQTEKHKNDQTSGAEEISIYLPRTEQPSSIHCLDPAGPVMGGKSTDRMGSMEPRHISYRILEQITNGFSDNHRLGRGRFGVVYKGVDKNGQEIAVKLLHNTADLDDKLFCEELQYISRLKHSNIVQFVGFCSEEEEKCIEHQGKLHIAVQMRRALCFEYMHNGSLDRYISDEHQGLSWQLRYRIIKGICEGLKYLHTGLPSPIVHLDLKPANILLDENMTPKISDFFMSRLIRLENTKRAAKVIGTLQYMPPEYKMYGLISKGYDIYSLGVTIIMIVVGPEGPSLIDDTGPTEFVELMLKKWRERLQNIPGYKSFEADCEQVKKCIEIASQCIEQKRSRRPSIELIVDLLCQTGKQENDLTPGIEELRFAFTELQIRPISTELLDIYPPQLRFSFTPNKSNSRSLQLTNKSHDCVAVRIQSKGSKRYKMPIFGIVPPCSKYTLVLTTREQKKPPPNNNDSLTLESIIVREGDHSMKHVDADSAIVEYKNIFKKARETDANNVHELTFPIVFAPPGDATSSSQPLVSEVEIISNDFAHVLSINVHPTKPWIMTSHYGGNVLIWNYKKQETKNIFKITTEPVYSTKFIERERWLAAGDRNGTIYIYNYYCPEEEVRSIEDAHDRCITSLDVHPTEPFMLSSSDDHLIKLWDWENGWKCSRIFEGHLDRVTQVNLLPTDAYRFASASMDHTIRIWDISSSESKMTLRDRPDGLLCMQNYISNNRKYFISGFGDGCAQVWDIEEERCVQTLEGHLNRVSSVYSHPELGVVITGSYDGTVRVWNSTTYRLENIIGVNLGAVYSLGYIESLERVVIGCYQGLAIVKL